MHELLLVRAAAVHHVGQVQALADAQLLVQVQHRFGRRLTAEDVVRDAAKREHVEAGAMRGVGTGGLGCEVDEARVFNVVLDMARAGRAVHGVGRGRVTDVSRSGLPVHQPQLRMDALDVLNQNALWAERAVV